MTEPPLTLIRPALELAWAVARVGTEARPAVAAPGPLRPLMRFAKLSPRALTTLRDVVSEDEEFRLRVAEAADEAIIGHASWLWLRRLDGWEEALDALVEEATAADASVADERAERQARRRLANVEAALARSVAETAAARIQTAAAAEALGEERRGRRQAEAALREQQDQLESARADAKAQRSVRQAAEEAAASDREDRLAVERRLNVVEAERAELIGALERQVGQLDAARSQLAAHRDERASSASALAEGVADAARAAGELGAALVRTARVLDPQLDIGGVPIPAGSGGSGFDPASGERDVDTAVAAVAVGAGGAPATGSGGAPTTGSAPPPLGRVPVRLPPAVFDDSDAAAAHLVRVPAMLVVVDGYNVTLSAWPEAPLAQQRQRLTDAMAELAMRSGAAMHVVFDGDEHHQFPTLSAGVRRAVKVDFSPAGVDADEVIIELVEDLPRLRPVVVATDDRRLRREVACRGANVISVAQLLGIIGRSAAPGDRSAG